MSKCGPCSMQDSGDDFHEFCYWFDGDDCDCSCHADYVRYEALPIEDSEELMAIHVYEDSLYEIEQDGELTDFGFLPLPEDPEDEETE